MSDTTSDERLMYDMLRFVLIGRADALSRGKKATYLDTVNLARAAGFALLAPASMGVSKELVAALIYRICAPAASDSYVDSVAERHDNWWRLMGGAKWLTDAEFKVDNPGFIHLCKEAPVWVQVAAACVLTSVATRYGLPHLSKCLEMMTRVPGTLKMFLAEEIKTITDHTTL